MILMRLLVTCPVVALAAMVANAQSPSDADCQDRKSLRSAGVSVYGLARPDGEAELLGGTRQSETGKMKVANKTAHRTDGPRLIRGNELKRVRHDPARPVIIRAGRRD